MNTRSIIRPGQKLILPGDSKIAVPSTIKPIVVPPGATTHVVKQGDNLTELQVFTEFQLLKLCHGTV